MTFRISGQPKYDPELFMRVVKQVVPILLTGQTAIVEASFGMLVCETTSSKGGSVHCERGLLSFP